MVKVAEVRYGNRIILREQSLEIGKGLNCLVGPSGLGKTTLLLQLVKALKWPFVPQDLSLPSHQLVESLAEHVASLNKCCSKAEYWRRFVSLLREVGLEDALGRKVGTLSLGEKQRLLVVLQLARGCKKLLADEPTSQLDPMNSLKLMSIIKREVERALVVTHDLAAIRLCDKLYTIDDGKVVEGGEEALGVDLDCLDVCFRSSRL